MKANRFARVEGRGFRDDERGVSEVVGYMIAFGMSSIILVMSLAAFNMMRDHTGDMVADRSVKEVANRVSFGVEEALQAGSQFPESEFERKLRLPQLDNHGSYTVELSSEQIRVFTKDAGPPVFDEDDNEIESMGRAIVSFPPRANAHVLCLDADTSMENGRCSVSSEEGELIIVYGEPHTECTADDVEDDPNIVACRGVYFGRQS